MRKLHPGWPPSPVHSTRKHPLAPYRPPVHRPACFLQRAHHFSLDHEDGRGLAPLPTEAVAWLGRRGRRSRARGEYLLHWRSGSLCPLARQPLPSPTCLAKPARHFSLEHVEARGPRTLRTKTAASLQCLGAKPPCSRGNGTSTGRNRPVRSTRKHPLPFCFPPVLRPAYPLDRAHHFSLEHVHARGLAPLPTWAVAWLGRHEVTAPCSRRAQSSLAVKLPAQHSEAPFAPSAGNLSQAQRASRNQHITFASTTRTPGVQPLCPRGRGASAWPHLLWSTSARSLSANRPHSTSSSIFPRPPRLPWRSTTQGQDSRLALVPMGGDPVLEGSATSTVRLRRCTELGRRPFCPLTVRLSTGQHDSPNKRISISLDHDDARGLAPLPTEAASSLGPHRARTHRAREARAKCTKPR